MFEKAGKRTREALKRASTSLRIKVTGLLLLAIVALMVVIYLLAHPIIMGMFMKEEKRQMHERMEQVSEVLNEQINHLSEILVDWSIWDDTYTFVQDQNETYINSNLNQLTMVNLKINIMAFVNNNKDVVYLINYIDIVQHDLSFSDELAQYFSEGSPLLVENNDITTGGFISLRNTPFILASHPILKSDGFGPSQGWLVFGRFLTAEDLQTLENNGGFKEEIFIRDINDFETNTGNDILSFLSAEDQVFIKVIDEDTISGYFLIKDIKGSPCFVLQVVSSRPVNALARSVDNSLKVITVFIIFILVCLLVFFNEKLILSRILTMTRDINQISDFKSPEIRLITRGDDELATLAYTINKMLDNLESASHSISVSETKYKELAGVLQKALNGTTQAMAAIVEVRDPYTSRHQVRVAKLAQAIASKLGLSPEASMQVYTAGLVHDIGKMTVPAEILAKSGKLSPVEFSLVQLHPQKGYEILRNIDFPYDIARWVLQHHERMDGSGYPVGLKGSKLTLEARILAVADVVEAMSAHRPYRASLGLQAALDEISVNRGILYDEKVVDTCLALFRVDEFMFD